VHCGSSASARISVRERVAYDGSVLLPLCEADVLQAVETLRAAGVASIAICFLHSYTNPTHERRAAELVRAACLTALEPNPARLRLNEHLGGE
jgi:N-methylhydantoinase A/oxoprolinase/acetone carboxylase beta subunit